MQKNFEELASIGWNGEQGQGRDCLSYTENEDRAHEQFKKMGENLRILASEKGLNLSVEEDPFGNSYVVLEGESPKSLIVCSHLDSVPEGGKYDGVLGVAAGIDLIERVVNEGIKPKKTIKAVAFRSEESSVTRVACLGSSLATGNCDWRKLSNIEHKMNGQNSRNFLEILRERGLDDQQIKKHLKNPYLSGDDIEAVIEVHTEQSSILESMDEPVAVVVHGIGGAIRNDIVISNKEGLYDRSGCDYFVELKIFGRADHSAGTPMNGETINGKVMDLRKDALVYAMKIVKELNIEGLIDIRVLSSAINKVPGVCVIYFESEKGEDSTGLREKLELYCSKHGIDFNLNFHKNPIKNIERIRDEVSLAVADVVCACEEIATDFAMETQGQMRATVAEVAFREKVRLGLDQRMLDEQVGLEHNKSVGKMLREKSSDGVSIAFKDEEPNISLPSRFVDPALQQIMRETYEELFGTGPVEFGMMPGHDASKVIRAKGKRPFVPGGMIAVRSLNGGVSHNPQELCSEDDMQKACDLLFAVTKKICF